VKLSSTVPAADVKRIATDLATREQGHIRFIYESILPGFAITGITDAAARRIAASPFVDLVEEDAEMTIASSPQLNAPWHLDRLDQRNLPLDTMYNYLDCIPTHNPVIYIVDTGVRASHHEFWTSSTNTTSRVLPGKDYINQWGNETSPCTGGDSACPGLCPNGGHGTAVASVAAGLTYGVAKSATIIPVRVSRCDGHGDTSVFVQGLDWIYNNPPNGPGIVNISSEEPAGDPGISLLETAIDNLVNIRGLTVVVSAGNGNLDALSVSPARHSHANGATAITVGGTNNQDHRWVCNSANSFEQCSSNTVGSNWGTTIDLFAPAQNISSASFRDWSSTTPPYAIDSDTAERLQSRSGTSFSSPIVAGIAARYLLTTAIVNPTPANVWSYLVSSASGDAPSTPPSVLIDATGGDPNSGPLNGSPNRLTYAQYSPRCH
jgi:subtilisin family serine protease